MPANDAIEVRQFIDDQRFSAYQWRVLALCFLITALDGLDTASIGFVAPMLVKTFHVTRDALGPTLGAALIGYSVGSMIAGPVADRVGRRMLIIASVATFGFWCLASGFAGSLSALAALRFLTGIGLGAAMPNATALIAEYAPARWRALLVTTMFCGFTLGSAAGGLLAAWIIPAFGWRSVLYAGGVLPLLTIPVLIAWLPESARFLVSAGAPRERIGALLRRIAPDAVPAGARFVVAEEDARASSVAASLFAGGRAVGTLLLWLAFFMGLLVIYLLTSWLPTIIHDAGFTIADAARVGALWQIGGTVGALLVGWAMDRISPHRAVALAYLIGAACTFGTSYAHGSLLLLSIGVFGAGFCISGAQTSMNALAAMYYPTRGRATGISWMLGIGRFGAIVGAVFGGALLAAGGTLDAVLALLAAPVALAGLAVVAKERYARSGSSEPKSDFVLPRADSRNA
ncbi:MFS transporter [Burkholderia mayonis]|uniref:4-hydroxybenzoate transporter n=1 Tax=Burkholderia mayonis TaxID=1385591 RepID=A0A1B4G3P8_9BURK|nr:MFS transporter [Burkholderia mayonis]AOJ10546.1 4-hydroxybenzoate transporter [Burkholderia mayonis]KVE57169.1 4-hydroxybenzoate transporter [Burkholderia mayonis]